MVLIASGSPFEPVTDGDQYLLDTARFFNSLNTSKPEPRPFNAIAGPDTQNVASPIRRDAHHDIEPGCCEPARHGPSLSNRVDEDDQVERIQRPAQPFGEFPGDLLGDPTDRVLRRPSPP